MRFGGITRALDRFPSLSGRKVTSMWSLLKPLYVRRLILFLRREKDACRDVAFHETPRSQKSTIFLTMASNDYGWFIKVTEWRSEKKNLFIVIPADLEFSSWTNMVLVLEQMVNAKHRWFHLL